MKHVSLVASVVFAALTSLLAACGTSDQAQGTAEPAGAPGVGPGAGGSVVPVLTPAMPLAVTEVAVYQGVKVTIVKGGEHVAERNAPLIAGRRALVRVFVEPKEGYTPRKVIAELSIRPAAGEAPAPLRDSRSIEVASTEVGRTSTFNFEVSGEALTQGATFSVTLREDTGDGPLLTAEPVRYPAGTAQDDLEFQPTGKLKIVLVPVRYDGDGTQRLPDVSSAQLERYRRKFLTLYPTSEVEVIVHDPFPWPTAISANGSGFSGILEAMIRLRRTERASDDTYYYGAFAPNTSFERYCSRGCVTGLSGVVEAAGDAYLRASVGLGFTGESSADTMAHEIGHAHGREHAPCGGASGPDRKFPDPRGGIRVWGYDIFQKTFIDPAKGKDMMGYCEPAWVSDYTYSALHERLLAVGSTAKAMSLRTGANTSYRMLTVDGDGAVLTSNLITLDRGPEGPGSSVEYLGEADGRHVVARGSAHFVPFDHLPGGIVVVPERAEAYRSLRIALPSRMMELKLAR